MTNPQTTVLLARLTFALVLIPALAGADEPSSKQGSGYMRSVGPRCPDPIPYRLVGSRELTELTEKVSESIKAVHTSMEEWGTLTLSGLLLAPPVSGGSATFGVDINNIDRIIDPATKGKYNFEHWFTESGKAEGSAQFSERIFNSLIASGTLQLAPEQAAIAASIFQKQRVDQQLFQDQLGRNRVESQSQLEDFRQSRQSAIQARQVRIDAAKAAADRARAARDEAELDRRDSARRKTIAERALQKAKDATPPAGQDIADRQADLDRANTEFTTADNNLRARTTEEKTSQDSYAAAIEAGIKTGTLPGSDVTTPAASPTLGQSTFNFATEATPGESFTQAKSFASSVPAVTATNINTLGSTQLPDVLGLKPGTKDPEAVFPARGRLIDAAGNQTIARIFDFLGDPSAALQFKDKPIVMAAGTIAVNPGWRTWQDYDGQIDVSAKYFWHPARRVTCERIARAGGLFNQDEITVADHFASHGLWPVAGAYVYTGIKKCLQETTDTPLAAAVSPLMERQNIDQASSRAHQSEIALFLSASLAKSGQKAAGDIFDKYVKLSRLDVKTRSALPVVNSYGLGGSRFGFNVTSRLQAIGEINKGKAGNILEKQNFPILVVFGLSADDLRPRLVRNPETGSAEIWEPQIILTQTHRWGRQKKRGVFHQGLRSVVFPGFPGRPMESPAQAYDLMDTAKYWRNQFNLYLHDHGQLKKSDTVNSFINASEEDYDFLNQAGFGAVTQLDVPIEYLVGPAPARAPVNSGRATILNVFPDELTPRAVTLAGGAVQFEAEVVVVGSNLDLVDATKITAAAGAVTVTKVPLPPGISSSQAIALHLVFAAAPSAFQLRVPVGAPGANGFQQYLYSPMITTAKPLTAAVNAVTSGLDVKKTGVQTLELFVKAVGVTSEDLARAVVEVSDPGGSEWHSPVLGRVHRNDKDPEEYLVEVIADVPRDFTEGALRLLLKPQVGLAQNGMPMTGDLRSSEIHLRVR